MTLSEGWNLINTLNDKSFLRSQTFQDKKKIYKDFLYYL